MGPACASWIRAGRDASIANVRVVAQALARMATTIIALRNTERPNTIVKRPLLLLADLNAENGGQGCQLSLAIVSTNRPLSKT